MLARLQADPRASPSPRHTNAFRPGAETSSFDGYSLVIGGREDQVCRRSGGVEDLLAMGHTSGGWILRWRSRATNERQETRPLLLGFSRTYALTARVRIPSAPPDLAVVRGVCGPRIALDPHRIHVSVRQLAPRGHRPRHYGFARPLRGRCRSTSRRKRCITGSRSVQGEASTRAGSSSLGSPAKPSGIWLWSFGGRVVSSTKWYS